MTSLLRFGVDLRGLASAMTETHIQRWRSGWHGGGAAEAVRRKAQAS